MAAANAVLVKNHTDYQGGIYASAVWRNADGAILLTPAWMLSWPNRIVANFYKSVQWQSPDYYPAESPGPYGRGACSSGAYALLAAKDWSGGWGGASASWSHNRPTGHAYSFGNCGCTVTIHDTRYWKGFEVTGIKVDTYNYKSAAGAGSAKIGFLTSDDYPAPFPKSLGWLGGEASIVITGNGRSTHNIGLTLGNFLTVTNYIDSFSPPTNPDVYPDYARKAFQMHDPGWNGTTLLMRFA